MEDKLASYGLYVAATEKQEAGEALTGSEKKAFDRWDRESAAKAMDSYLKTSVENRQKGWWDNVVELAPFVKRMQTSLYYDWLIFDALLGMVIGII